MTLFYRRIIRIRGQDSPNVRLGLAQVARGEEPTNEVLVPGVLTYEEYIKRRNTWDRVRQSIGLDARFWEGSESLMYPPDWLNRAEQIGDALSGKARRARGMGVDPGEGDANTCWTVVDDYGIIEQVSIKTPDTSEVTARTLALMRKHLLDADQIAFDRGGGGKEHADRLRLQGYDVRTIAFGEPVMLPIKSGLLLNEERIENREERYAYKNRRAQMYGELRVKLDPGVNAMGFGLPSKYVELRRQLAPIPLKYDAEGRMFILPKNKRDPNSREKTLIELLGCSPDEADSLVLALFVMCHEERQAVAGIG